MLLNEGGRRCRSSSAAGAATACAAPRRESSASSVTARGAAGHASIPQTGDNALLKLAPGAAADRRRGSRRSSSPSAPAAMLRGLGEDPARPGGALARIGAAEPALLTLLEPMFGVTLTPTMIHASDKINVIPARAELKIDCRVPPGLGEEAARRRIERGPRRATPTSCEIEFTEQVIGNESPVPGPLVDAIDRWIRANDPGRRDDPGDPPRLLGLALVPRRVPRVRRLRLLPPARAGTARGAPTDPQRRRTHRRSATSGFAASFYARHRARAARLDELPGGPLCTRQLVRVDCDAAARTCGASR